MNSEEIKKQIAELQTKLDAARVEEERIAKQENFKKAQEAITRVRDDLENLHKWGYMPKALSEALSSGTGKDRKVSVRLAIRPLREPSK